MSLVVVERSGSASSIRPAGWSRRRNGVERLADHAVRFIEGTKDSDQPFFLCVGTRCGRAKPYKDVLVEVEVDYRIGPGSRCPRATRRLACYPTSAGVGIAGLF